MSSADGPSRHESGFFQHFYVLGYGLKRHIVMAGEVCDTAGTLLAELR